MKIMATSIAASLILLSSTSFAYKDLVIDNHTDVVATAKTKFSPCSADAGDAGRLKPHSPLSIPQYVRDLFCVGQCDVELYISDHCSGPSVSTVHINQLKGVTGITNHNQGSYRVTGSGYNVALDGSSKSGIMNFLSKIL